MLIPKRFRLVPKSAAFLRGGKVLVRYSPALNQNSVFFRVTNLLGAADFKRI
jgi:hypothetical protein